MSNIYAMAQYAMRLYSAPKHKEFRLCMCDSVRYYNNGVYNHELCCQVAKVIASWRQKKQTNPKQLSLF